MKFLKVERRFQKWKIGVKFANLILKNWGETLKFNFETLKGLISNFLKVRYKFVTFLN